MFNNRFLKRNSKLLVIMLISMLLVAAFAPASFALNSNQTDGSSTGNKPLDFYGYQYVDRSHVYLFFDKTIYSTDVTAGQFTVTLHNSPYTATTVSSITVTAGTGYSGCSDTSLDKGTRITLNLAADLSYDTPYDVTMKAATIFMGAGNTLGNYYYRNDFEFTFRTPDSSGNYSNTTPIVTYTESNTGDTTKVSYESNLGVIFDRPMNSANVSSFLSGLSSNYKKGPDGSQSTVVQDSTMDANWNSSAECYTPHANDAHNTFFFPEVTNGATNSCYDRDSSGSHHYTLTLPSFTDVSNNTFSTPGSFSFDTVSGDLPGWLNQTVTATAGSSSGELDVSWAPGTLEPIAEDFDVYYSLNSGVNTNPLTNTYTKYNSPTLSQDEETGEWSTTLTLTSGSSYFIRIVPKNNNGTVGFSRHATGTAN